jgi:hypothetical protein
LILERLADSPTLLDFVSRWGVLFELDGELGAGLRRLALKFSDARVRVQYVYDEIHAFNLKLPQEAGFLPHLVNMLVESTISPYPHFEKEERSLTREERMSELVGKYVSDPKELIKIVHKHDFSTRVRAASTILVGFHPTSIRLECPPPSKEDFLELYDPLECNWYIPAVALLLTDAIAAGQQDAMEAMGCLIDRAQADFGARIALNPVLNSWRELARAPVQKLATPNLWT